MHRKYLLNDENEILCNVCGVITCKKSGQIAKIPRFSYPFYKTTRFFTHFNYGGLSYYYIQLEFFILILSYVLHCCCHFTKSFLKSHFYFLHEKLLLYFVLFSISFSFFSIQLTFVENQLKSM